MRSVLDELARYGDNPSAFLALNGGNEFFRIPGRPGVVAYRTAGRYLVQFGGPFAPEPAYQSLLAAFLEHAARLRRRVVGVQLQEDDARVYARHGFTVNQLGASYAVDLSRFTLHGAKFMRLRNKISRAQRSGLTVEQVDAEAAASELADVDAAWLAGKGRHVKALEFLVGERTGDYQELRRVFAGRLDGRIVAYISYSPVYGRRPGWLHDLSRRRTGVPPGVMEAINVAAIERMTAEAAGWLHFGFTPFTGLDRAFEVETASPTVSRIVDLLARHGERVYPARTQLEYKQKWGPHAVTADYVGFHGRPRLGAIWRLLRLTNAI
ncbi:DUF2156 domain-containing protein [Actinomycetes bacterium KLBMP 9797]